MKRWLILCLLVVVAVMAVTAAGCGSSGDTASSGDGGEGGTSLGEIPGQAEAATCAANRRTVSGAAQQYFTVEGAYPSSIQALVPGYLQRVPVCPSGGSYRLQGKTVTCSVHGS